jgi:hypothetical protein
MEQLVKILAFTLFGASALCFAAGVVLWISACWCLVPEAQDRYRWNPMNATMDPRKNLTPEGRARLTLAGRAFLLWIALALLAMIVVPILMLIFGIEMEPRADEKESPTGIGGGPSSR